MTFEQNTSSNNTEIIPALPECLVLPCPLSAPPAVLSSQTLGPALLGTSQLKRAVTTEPEAQSNPGGTFHPLHKLTCGVPEASVSPRAASLLTGQEVHPEVGTMTGAGAQGC